MSSTDSCWILGKFPEFKWNHFGSGPCQIDKTIPVESTMGFKFCQNDSRNCPEGMTPRTRPNTHHKHPPPTMSTICPNTVWITLSQTIHLVTPTFHPNRYTQTLFQLYNNSGITANPLYSCIQTLSKISVKNTSIYCSLPCQVLLPLP